MKGDIRSFHMGHGSLICSKRLLNYQGSTFLNVLYLVLLLTHDQTKCWSVAQGNNSQCLPDSWIPQWVNLWMDRVFTTRKPYSFPAGKNNQSPEKASRCLTRSMFIVGKLSEALEEMNPKLTAWHEDDWFKFPHDMVVGVDIPEDLSMDI